MEKKEQERETSLQVAEIPALKLHKTKAVNDFITENIELEVKCIDPNDSLSLMNELIKLSKTIKIK